MRMVFLLSRWADEYQAGLPHWVYWLSFPAEAGWGDLSQRCYAGDLSACSRRQVPDRLARCPSRAFQRSLESQPPGPRTTLLHLTLRLHLRSHLRRLIPRHQFARERYLTQ